MSKRERNNEKGSKEEGGGGGGGGASTFWKVVGAAAAAVEAGGSGGAAHTNEGAAAVWTKPKVGWVKLNVDGSLLREIPSPARCGGVIRDASGKWLYGFAQKLSPSLKEDETEKEAIFKGLQWGAHGKGVRKLAVESDNEGIVNKVNSGTQSTTDPLILAIRELLNNRSLRQQATSTWIPGDANQVADKLADVARSRSFTSLDLKEIDSPPQNCLTALAGGGWASMLLKIAGVAVATGVVGPVATGVVGPVATGVLGIAGELYSVLKQPEIEQVAFGAGGGSGGVHTDQEGAVWTKPMVGCWVKQNVDGSLLLHIPSAGCGGVLRDLSGTWMDGFTQKLSPSLKVDETEKKGILKVLQRAKGKGTVKKLVWWSLIMLGLRIR